MASSIYEELVIKVGADTKDAHTKLNNLSTSLDNLGKATKRFDLSHLEEIKGLLQEISKIKFDSLIMGLNSVVNAFDAVNSKTFSTTRKALSEMATAVEKLPEDSDSFSSSLGSIAEKNAEFQKATDIIKTFSKDVFGATPTIDGLKDSLERAREQAAFASTTFAEFDKEVNTLKANTRGANSSFEELGQKLSEIGLNGTQMEEVLKNIDKETKVFSSQQIEQVRKAMEELGYSTEQVEQTISGLKTETIKAAKQVNNQLSKVVIKIKSLALYRVIRLALMKIQQGIQEAIQQLAQVDSGFNESISKLVNTFRYLANSIIAMFSPIIQIVAPIIETIGTLIGDLANAFGELFSSALGKDTFTEATKGAEDYAESLKEVKSQALGIDELNVVSEQEQTSLFSTKDIESTNTLGDVFANIKEELGEIVKSVKDLFVALKPILNVVIDLFKYLLQSTSEKIHESIAAFVEALASIFEFVGGIVEMLKPILDVFNILNSLALNQINDSLTTTSRLINSIFKLLSPIIKILTPIIDIISLILELIVGVIGGLGDGISGALSTVVEFVAAVLETLGALFSGNANKIGEIWEKLGERLKNIWRGVGNFFIDILNTMAETIENFINSMINSIKPIASNIGIDTSEWGVHLGRIPRLATGGLVEDGFFFANHNELVGNFADGTTAVANNEQITTGIYRAVLDAMRDSGGDRNVNVYLDGKQIANKVNEVNDNRGKQFYTGGNLSYGK